MKTVPTERLAFDTNALIYFLDRVPPYAAWLDVVMARVRSGQSEAVVSVIVEAEIMIRPLRLKDTFALKSLELFLQSDNVHLIDVDRTIAIEAARVRAETNLKLPDSIIVATATQTSSVALIGNDKDCAKRVSGIRYVYLNDEVERKPGIAIAP